MFRNCIEYFLRVCLLCLCVFTARAYAVTMPSQLPLQLPLQSKGNDALDPALDAWFAGNIPAEPVTNMTPSQVLEFVKNKDPVTRTLVVLNYEPPTELTKINKPTSKEQSKEQSTVLQASKDLDTLTRQVIQDVPKLLQEELGKPPERRSLLLGEVVLAWEQRVKKTDQMLALEDQVFSSEWSTGKGVSCAMKSRAIRMLSREHLGSLKTAELVNVVNQAKSYRSLAHRRKYLEAVAQSLPEKRRGEVVDLYRKYATELPLLVKHVHWISSGDEDDNNFNPTVFANVMRLLRKKKCSAAEGEFGKYLQKNLPKDAITAVVDAGSEIERCFRAEKRIAASEFWVRISPKMEKQFGKPGQLWAKIRLGYLKWISSDLDDAQKIYAEILQEAQPGSTDRAVSYRMIVAKSNYILGKIAEDNDDYDRAAKYFLNYISEYSDLEDFEFALNSLIVNYAAKKAWTSMIPPLQHFLAQQSMVYIDKRPVGPMAFSLFWLGRAQLQLGHIDLALEIWRRLAAEYYSTFYGAMGHYLVEQVTGRSFAIEPSRVNGFDMSQFESKLDVQNQVAAKRSEAFLQAGFPDKGRCEIEEVVASSPSDYDTLLVRTLLLYASGSWLDAIKIFDGIPRSIRNALPVGFERILFPRKYAEIVIAQSSKLDIDPNFVFALMRQESVFSKDAMSPVGATGLMQLMPATARMEVGKLTSPYVDSAERAEISSALKNDFALRDPNLNVTLGVHHLWRLMQTYKSPVFALTAYNASPAATQKWQRTIASDDWLTFIERIPYKETRAYVKLILRNYFYYKRWYNIPDGKGQVHIDSVVDEMVLLAKTTQEKKGS